MRYLRVKWRHHLPDEPTLIASELDVDGWEIRKVEQFADGRLDFANGDRSTGSTQLSETPIPPLAEIAQDPQFEPEEIQREIFEELWSRATSDNA